MQKALNNQQSMVILEFPHMRQFSDTMYLVFVSQRMVYASYMPQGVVTMIPFCHAWEGKLAEQEKSQNYQNIEAQIVNSCNTADFSSIGTTHQDDLLSLMANRSQIGCMNDCCIVVQGDPLWHGFVIYLVDQRA